VLSSCNGASQVFTFTHGVMLFAPYAVFVVVLLVPDKRTLTQTVSRYRRSEDMLGVEAEILGTRQQHHLRSA
jgi:hypothetical protein